MGHFKLCSEEKLPRRGSIEDGSLKIGRTDIVDMGRTRYLRWWGQCCGKDQGC